MKEMFDRGCDDIHGHVLALDLGSTAWKAGWVDGNGVVSGLVRQTSPLGQGCRDAEQIWQALIALLRLVADAADAPPHIIAVALTGATRTHVLTDAHLNAIAPLVPWSDPMGADHAQRVAQACQAQTADGHGAYHPLARLLHLQDAHRPATPSSLAEIKDWLNARLCGVLASDAVTAGRIAPMPQSRSLADTLAALGMPAHAIPATVPPDTVLGVVTGDAWQDSRLHGVPVVTGSFDTWAATVGMGAVRVDGVYDMSGTTQVMGRFTAEPTALQGMVSLPWSAGLWHVGGPCQTGLSTLAWFARTFLGSDTPQATLDAAQAAMQDTPPLCLPYADGERMPLWDASLSASFHDVRAAHGVADLARALVEGLVMAHRLALDCLGVRSQAALQRASMAKSSAPLQGAVRQGAVSAADGAPGHGDDANQIPVIRMSGGGARLPFWCAQRASGFGLPVQIDASPEPALTGAAVTAWSALGLRHGLDWHGGAQDAAQRILPDPARQRYYDARMPLFLQRLEQVRQAG